MFIDNPEMLQEVLESNPLWVNKSTEELITFVFDRTRSIFGLTTLSLVLCVFYGILFCFGLIGNLWVISVVVYILKTLRHTLPNHNVFVYILCLSAVDSFVLMIIPMLISDILFYRWLFGPFLCKLYYIIESSNKLLSTFMLAALSCDRFLAVCYPDIAKKVRTTKKTIILVTILFLFVTVILAPLHYTSGETFYRAQIAVDNQTFVINLPECSLAMTKELMITFTIYLFVIGFCIPGLLITFFYAKVLCRIYNHAKSFGDHQTHIPVRRVTVATLLVIIFYFVCWTPYWSLTMYHAIAPEQIVQPEQIVHPPNSEQELYSVLISYFFHSLVYVNSALNWVFYALLNKHLRESHEAAVERNRTYSSSKITRTPPRIGESPVDVPQIPWSSILVRFRVDSKSSGVSSYPTSLGGDPATQTLNEERFL